MAQLHWPLCTVALQTAVVPAFAYCTVTRMVWPLASPLVPLKTTLELCTAWPLVGAVIAGAAGGATTKA